MHNDLISKRESFFKESMNTKLLKLNVVKFSENKSEWLTFWSAFETAIHNYDSWIQLINSTI